ncbi:MAG: anion permease [Spirochaetes bacterium]|nr:anion permease [Spirochaetota bacterium]
MTHFYLSSGIFLGWSLGANDAANVFGTAVSSRMIRYRSAVILTSIFIILGAVLEGTNGIKTLGGLTNQDLQSAFISALAAALTVTFMTLLKLPVSTSQAAVGAIMGIGIFHSYFNFASMTKVFICWIGTPIGAMLIAIILYMVLSKIINHLNLNLIQLDYILRFGLILGGTYGAYALGANNVANVIGVFSKISRFSPGMLALIGGVSIAFGVITFSKNVMLTVGKKLVPMGAFSALIAILGEAITVHIYAKIGVPVSTSQAIIGAVLGIGIIKGMQTINMKTLYRILLGWTFTPIMAGLMSLGLVFLINKGL